MFITGLLAALVSWYFYGQLELAMVTDVSGPKLLFQILVFVTSLAVTATCAYQLILGDVLLVISGRKTKRRRPITLKPLI